MDQKRVAEVAYLVLKYLLKKAYVSAEGIQEVFGAELVVEGVSGEEMEEFARLLLVEFGQLPDHSN